MDTCFKKVLVIGAGGTGSLLLGPLVRYLNSIEFDGSLVIADGDTYSDSNIDRQMFSAKNVGKNKAEYQASLLGHFVPAFADNITYLDKYLSKADIEGLVQDNTIVINCVDNKAARKYVEDKCLSLQDAAHICCGNEFRSGQIQVSLRRNNEQITPSIFDEAPELNDSNDDRSTMSCEDLAQLPGGGQIIVANMMAATLALAKVVQLTSSINLYKNGNWLPSSSIYFDWGTDAFKVNNSPLPGAIVTHSLPYDEVELMQKKLLEPLNMCERTINE